MVAEKRSDELVLTFECEDESGWVQDMVVEVDMSVLTMPLNIGHTLNIDGVEAVITSIVHYWPDEPGKFTEMAVRAEVGGGRWTKERLALYLTGMLGLSNPRVPSVPYNPKGGYK